MSRKRLSQTVGGIRIEAQSKRGDIHILLLGDPGVAKSQLLDAAVKAAPGSYLYDCSQASQAGLVAAAEKLKDAISGESWGIKAGALALTPDHAICALDEFHLLGGKDKTVTESLNVALESQEVRISKAAKGVVRTRVAVHGCTTHEPVMLDLTQIAQHHFTNRQESKSILLQEQTTSPLCVI